MKRMPYAADAKGMSAILAKAISPLVAQTRVLQTRLAGTTPRERLLLGALILGALVYAPIAAIDWRTQQEDRYLAAQADQSTVRLALSASRAIAAQAPDELAIEDMQTWGFEAGNIAIAQVQIEQGLVAAAADAELANVRITTDAEIETIGPTQWLGSDVQADLRWTPTFDFLESLAEWPEGFRVTQFRYEITTPANFVPTEPGFVPAGRIQIGLSFPVKVPETEPAA
jgi:hypothetical protein